MKFVGFMGVAMALALASTSTLAFQEQGGAPVPVAPAADASAQKAPEAGLAGGSAGSTAGTEVRIPGLGKLGVLPKMDFGLELLYGANEGRPTPEVEQNVPDDLTVRGTVKHNF